MLNSMNMQHKEYDENNLPSFRLIATIIAVPLFLILVNTFTGLAVDKEIVPQSIWTDILEFIGHPFSALITCHTNCHLFSVH